MPVIGGVFSLFHKHNNGGQCCALKTRRCPVQVAALWLAARGVAVCGALCALCHWQLVQALCSLRFLSDQHQNVHQTSSKAPPPGRQHFAEAPQPGSRIQYRKSACSVVCRLLPIGAASCRTPLHAVVVRGAVRGLHCMPAPPLAAPEHEQNLQLKRSGC